MPLPKSVTETVGSTDYFQVETRNGQIILTPVRIQRADAVRAKLTELGIDERDVADAVVWAGLATKRTLAFSRKGCRVQK